MKSWLSSPLVINYLLSLCKNGPTYQKKYLKINKDLKLKNWYMSGNKLFLSSKYNIEKQYETKDINIDTIEFGKSNDVSQCIMSWINQYESFNLLDLEKHVLPSTTSLLCNVSVFKSTWKCNDTSPIMKVHNSFSYTEDIKYEARLIELPMQDDDLKLVIIVPNEVTSITGLFNKLVDEGLTAAVRCVQPLFTFSTVFEAPSIEYSSEFDVRFRESNCNVVQTGNVQINENGTYISILTLLSSTQKKYTASVDEEHYEIEMESPFHFAVLYRDTAIFTGRYVKRLK